MAATGGCRLLPMEKPLGALLPLAILAINSRLDYHTNVHYRRCLLATVLGDAVWLSVSEVVAAEHAELNWH